MRIRPPSPGSRVATLGVALAAGVWAEAASAQTGCRFVDPTASVQGVTIAGLGQVLYVSRPSILCADGVRIRADSAVTYASQRRTELMGRVFFRDDTRELRSDQARYFSQQARLQASGNLFVRDTVRGTEIENGDLVYLRRADFRPEEEMTVTRGIDGVRPRARLYLQPAPDSVREEAAGVDSVAVAAVDTLAARDTLVVDTLAPRDTLAARDTLAVAPPVEPVQSTPAEPDTVPYLVEANRLFLQGERIFRAYGDVEIRRDSLNAYADSTAYDQTAGLILLQGSARVDGAGYDLSGREIGLGVPDGTVRSVRAVREGVLTGEDLRLTAPVIEIFLSEGVMQRLVATPLRPEPGATEPPDEAEEVRPVAEAEEFTLTADSIDVLAPDELLDRIIAVGTARGESHARDSLNVEALPDVALHDWLEGDTVIATFIPADTGAAVDAAAAADTARARYQL
ncbi:MAG TPA: hypothetical protein VK849_04025, partial [Longimicrobiales bacterium]|nr:hypothetical protein [Longimicrobiales bacterium]